MNRSIFAFILSAGLLLSCSKNSATENTDDNDSLAQSSIVSSSAESSSSDTSLVHQSSIMSSSVQSSSSDTSTVLQSSADTTTVSSSSSEAVSMVVQSSSSLEQSSSSLKVLPDSVTDVRDGQTYRTMKIGNQTWMVQNLNYSGDTVAGVRTFTKGWCYGVSATDSTQYKDSTTCQKGYGRLYNWTDAMNILARFLDTTATPSVVFSTTTNQGLCPANWHVSTATEWDTLAAFIRTDKSITASGSEGMYLKAVVDSNLSWNRTAYNAQDPYGFSALPAGYGDGKGIWKNRGTNAFYWSATENFLTQAFYRNLFDDRTNINPSYNYKRVAYPIRCVHN